MGSSEYCELIHNTSINKELFHLEFIWNGTPPKAGQFFMVKPKRSSVFLGRPISIANWQPNTLAFLIARRGTGTMELASMHSGEEAELIGPLGNAWSDFLAKKLKPGSKPIALIGGGVGLAPLHALLCEAPDYGFVLHAGFRTGFRTIEEEAALVGPAFVGAEKIIVASEDGKFGKARFTGGKKGLITDFLEPEQFSSVCACGPEAMLRTVAKKCAAASVPCYVSLERRMACGVGACLGCTVITTKGNKRCCKEGPIFPAEELIF